MSHGSCCRPSMGSFIQTTASSPTTSLLNTMGKADRHRWAERVLSQLGQHLRAVDSVTFLAGQRYREFLEPALRDMGLAVSVPMRGLEIGEQLSWLTGQSGD